MTSEMVVTDDSGQTDNTGVDAEADVDLSSMNDEEVEAFLSAVTDEEANPTPTQEPEPSKEGVTTPSEQKPQEKKEDAPVSRAEFDELLKRLQSQEKQVQGQEILLQRRTSELGEVKKQLTTVKAELEKRYREALENQDAEQALDLRDNLKAVDQNLKQVDEEGQKVARYAQTVDILQRHIPENEFNVDEIAESLAGDGVDGSYIEQFKKDPIGFVDGDYSPGLVLVQLARRARAESALKRLYNVTKTLVDENKKLKEGSSGVMKKIQNVAKQIPEISASGARPSRQGSSLSIDESQISKLTDAELEELLATQE